ncbi:hypothetical protein CSPX01_14363 [Colletotrichum filicis]|nr:hypothetical protein CSPX01_14363 [Colletotrichum filicis]
MNKVALALSKTSFAVTMLRIASGKLKVFIWFLIISMNAVLATSAVVAWKAACDRPSDSYEAVLPGSCWRVEDSVIMHMVSNAYSALVDFILSLLPWPMIWRLGLKRHEKIGVAVAMSHGVIAGSSISALIWGQAEINVTIVASSIPVLRVLFTEMYATSRSDERNGYLKSDGQSAFPTEIGMNTLEEGRKIEEETNWNVLLAMGPSTATNSAMRAHETEIGYNAMDEITQGTHKHTLRNSESYEGIELARALR